MLPAKDPPQSLGEKYRAVPSCVSITTRIAQNPNIAIKIGQIWLEGLKLSWGCFSAIVVIIKVYCKKCHGNTFFAFSRQRTWCTGSQNQFSSSRNDVRMKKYGLSASHDSTETPANDNWTSLKCYCFYLAKNWWRHTCWQLPGWIHFQRDTKSKVPWLNWDILQLHCFNFCVSHPRRGFKTCKAYQMGEFTDQHKSMDF